MKVEANATRHGRYLIEATNRGEAVARLSVSPRARDWYHDLYGSGNWARRMVQDYERLGTLDPRVHQAEDYARTNDERALMVLSLHKPMTRA